jgi:Cupin superfamily protein
MLLDIDPKAFGDSFDRAPTPVSHELVEHPLLTVESLAGLAERLPESKVEHNYGDLSAVQDPDQVQKHDMPVGEIARNIETSNSWMVLKNIELDPVYSQLLDQVLDEAEGLVAQRDGGMSAREGFIFLSSPGSVTPSHIDPEHNFLLQVRGSKDITVGRFPDSETEQITLENVLAGAHRNLELEPRESLTFHLEPGDGVYVNPHAPHWVQNGPAPSVSLSVTFQTPVNLRAIRVHKLNARLRGLGMSPAAPGRRNGVDRGKEAASRVLARLGRG